MMPYIIVVPKTKFINIDYHSIYRSFCCWLISISSSFIIFFNWDQFIENPMSYNIFSYLVNIFMLVYLGIDLIWIILKKKLRLERALLLT
jgi:hypothetical protein